MDLSSVPNDAVFADLNVVTDFQGANYAIFLNKNVIANRHLCVLEASLVFRVGWPDDTLLPYHTVVAHRYLCQVTSEHATSQNNCFSINQNTVTSFDQHLARNLVSFRSDKEFSALIIERVLFDHHLIFN